MSQSKEGKLSISDGFPFCEGVFPKLFHTNPTPQSLYNKADNKIIDVNAAWETFTGYKREEVIGRSIKKLNHISFNSNSENEFLVEQEQFKYFDVEIKKEHKESAYGLASCQYILFGGLTYVVSTILVVTELKESEKKLFLANNFTDRLLDSMHEALAVFDVDYTCIKVNKSYYELTGFKEQDIIGAKAPFPHWPAEHFDVIRGYVQQVLEGASKRQQLTMQKANGKRFEVSIITTKITNHNGEVIGYVSAANDISERLRFQNELQENSKKSIQKKDAILRLVDVIGKDFDDTLKEVTAISSQVMEVERVSIWQFNKDETSMHCLKINEVNGEESEKGTTLYTKDCPNYFKSLYKESSVRVDSAMDSELMQGLVDNYLKTRGISSLLDVFIKGVDGVFGVISFEHIGSPRKWTDEEDEFATMIASMVSLAVENSERKKVEAKLFLEKEFSEKLVDSLVEGLSVVSLDNKIIRVNKALCSMTGFTEQELIGDELPFKYWPPENYDDIITAFKKIDTVDSKTQEFTFMRKNGERFPVSLSFSTVKNEAGLELAYFATIVDISNRLKQEEFLKRRAQISHKRKEAISQLVSMVGRDYKSTIFLIAKLSANALNADKVTLWEFKNDESQLESKIFYNAKDDVLGTAELVLQKTDFSKYFEYFDRNSLLNIGKVNTHPITKDYAHVFSNESAITSRLDAVIHGKDMRYGLISFERFGRVELCSDEEENFAASVANIIWLMVESKERITAENQLINTNNLLQAVNTELKTLKKELEQENSYLREEIDLVFNYEEMVYGSRAFSDVLTSVEQVAATSATVLLLGESGTGKELIARAIHNISERKNKPLIKVNCAAIPKELIESELFGHKKGSFTGAFKDKLGKFQLADGGTLFLDEIGELPLEMQPKLLRAIQESEIEQIGGTTTQKVDIRIIAATNRDLEKEIKEKNFREDLFFRINVFPITIPPLRERIEDIPILIEHFVNKYTKLYNKKIKYISEKTKSSLQSYSWPGNVRELENLVERAVILSKDEKLNIPNFKSSTEEILISSTALSLDDVQRNYIKKILKQTHWKIEGNDGAANLLKVKPSTLRDRMKKFGIEKP